MALYIPRTASVIGGVLISLTACGGLEVGAQPDAMPGVVARVDGAAIMRDDLEREGASELRRLYRQVAEVERRALNRLIDEALLYGEAQRRGTDINSLLSMGRDEVSGESVVSSHDPVVERYRRRRLLLDELRRNRSVEVLLAPLTESLDTSVGVSVGPVGAPISVVEFSDPSCTYSAAMFGKLERLRAELGSKMQWTAVDISKGGSGAAGRLVAGATRCVTDQNRLIELRRALFQDGTVAKVSQDRSVLLVLAERLGLGSEEFMQCVNSKSWDAEVSRAVQEAVRLGVSETPAVFLNGRRLPQSLTLDAIREVVRAELESASRQSSSAGSR